MNKIVKNLFCILIFLSLVLIFKIIKVNFYNFNIHAFGRVTEPVVVNIEYKAPVKNINFICFNSNCKSYSSNPGNVYFAKYDSSDEGYLKDVLKYTVLFFNDRKVVDNIENIYAYVGENNYYFSKDDISKFESAEIKLKGKNFYALKLPVKNNFRGFLNAFAICFLSLFYNWKYFIVPYFCLFLAFLIYASKKEQFKIKAEPAVIAGIATVLGVILRFAQINYYPLWIDEVYCKNIALESFKTCFLDPGNPPLFFLAQKVVTSVISNSNLALRILPFFFGAAIIPFCYFFFKKTVKDKPSALFAAFFMSVNTVSIYLSQEAKSTTMCMFFTFFAVYFLFKYLKNQNNKNLLLYSISSFLLINLHYYLLIFAFSNFVYAAFRLYKKESFCELKKFLFINLLLFLTFIPYFAGVCSISLNNSFNTWIEPLNSNVIYDVIRLYFHNFKGFLVYIILILFQFVLLKIKSKTNLKVNENKKELLKYLIFSILFTVLIIVLISLLVKPIFNRRIFMSLYSLLFMLDVILFSTVLKLKKLKPELKAAKYVYQVLVVLFLFSITRVINERGEFSFDYLFHFIINDPQKSGYSYMAAIEDNVKYTKDYSFNKDIKWILIDANHTKYEFNINNYLNSKKPVIMYLRYVALNEYTEKKDTIIKVFETNNRNIAKIIYK